LKLSQDLDDLAILYLATVQAIAVRYFHPILKELRAINILQATSSLRYIVCFVTEFLKEKESLPEMLLSGNVDKSPQPALLITPYN
jgi:hypothetical protein